MCQEQLERLRGPKGRVLGQLERCGASRAQDCGGPASGARRGEGAPADAGRGAPGARRLVPRAHPERCFPAWLRPPRTIQLQSELALTAHRAHAQEGRAGHPGCRRPR